MIVGQSTPIWIVDMNKIVYIKIEKVRWRDDIIKVLEIFNSRSKGSVADMKNAFLTRKASIKSKYEQQNLTNDVIDFSFKSFQFIVLCAIDSDIFYIVESSTAAIGSVGLTYDFVLYNHKVIQRNPATKSSMEIRLPNKCIPHHAAPTTTGLISTAPSTH